MVAPPVRMVVEFDLFSVQRGLHARVNAYSPAGVRKIIVAILKFRAIWVNLFIILICRAVDLQSGHSRCEPDAINAKVPMDKVWLRVGEYLRYC